MLGRDDEVAPRFDRDVVGKLESEHVGRGEAGERVSRSLLARGRAAAPGRRVRGQHGPGIVVGPGVGRVRIRGNTTSTRTSIDLPFPTKREAQRTLHRN